MTYHDDWRRRGRRTVVCEDVWRIDLSRGHFAIRLILLVVAIRRLLRTAYNGEVSFVRVPWKLDLGPGAAPRSAAICRQRPGQVDHSAVVDSLNDLTIISRQCGMSS